MPEIKYRALAFSALLIFFNSLCFAQPPIQQYRAFCKNDDLPEISNQLLEAAYNCQLEKFIDLFNLGGQVKAVDCHGQDVVTLAAVGQYLNLHAKASECPKIAAYAITGNAFASVQPGTNDQKSDDNKIKVSPKKDYPEREKEHFQTFYNEAKEFARLKSIEFAISGGFQKSAGNINQDYRSITSELGFLFLNNSRLDLQYKDTRQSSEGSKTDISEAQILHKYPLTSRFYWASEFHHKSNNSGFERDSYKTGPGVDFFQQHKCKISISMLPGYRVSKADHQSKELDEFTASIASNLGCEVDQTQVDVVLSHEYGENLQESKANVKADLAKIFGIHILLNGEYTYYDGEADQTPKVNHDSLVGLEIKIDQESLKLWQKVMEFRFND